MFDRFTAVPVFLGAAAVLLGLGIYVFARAQAAARANELTTVVIPESLRPAARDALDLGPHDAIDHAG